MLGVFNFLGQATSTYPEKPQLRFAYALLNDEFGDKALAQEEFEEFLLKVNKTNDASFVQWISTTA